MEDPRRVLTQEQLIAIIDIQTEIARLGPDLYAVMQFVAERSQQLCCADGAVVELAEGDEMVYRAATGSAASQLGLRLRRQGSLSGLCTRLGKPLYCEDSENDPRVDREACRKVGVASMVVVPLIHTTEVVGVLKVLSSEPARFSDTDLAFLGQISSLVASSMFFAGKYGMDALFRQATTDFLTSLSNRALFFDHLRAELSKANRMGSHFSILLLDMDRLKPINDELGHAAGDAALKALAERLAGLARAMDTVARIGGDEFALILPQISEPEQLDAVCQRIGESIARPFMFHGNALQLTASIGSATFPRDGDSIDMLVEAADQAMYAMKFEKRRV